MVIHRTHLASMNFTLPGFESWNLQIVCFGNILILEAIRDTETLSTVLQPMDDTRKAAHGLINMPSCSLIGH